MLAERLQNREEDASVGRVDGAALRGGVIKEVEHAIASRGRVALCGQIVQAHQVEQWLVFFLAFREVTYRGAVVASVVEDVHHKVV